MSESRADIQSGKYVLHNLKLTNYKGRTIDISFLMNSLVVRETISSLFLIYEFTIVDAVNLLERLIVTGNEKISMTLLKKDTPDTDYEMIEKHLVLTGIKDYSRPNNEGQVYKITAISETAFASTSKRISRSVSGVMSSMVSEIFDEVNYKSKLNVLDNTAEGNFKVVLPNYKVSDTFKLLLSKSQKVNGSPFYLYETLWHDVVLTSYEEMVKRPKFETYKLLSHDSTVQFSEENFDKNRTRIRSIDSKLGVSHFDGINSGAYFSRTHALDYSKKEYRYADYSLFNEQLPKLDKDYILDQGFTVSNKGLSEYADAKQYFISENSMAFGQGIDNLNNRFEASVAKKNMVTNNQTSLTHNISIDGDTRIRCGECIEISIPASTDPEILREISRDDLLSGKYLITSIVHNFDKDGNYNQRVSLRKDSINISMIEDKF